jgi:hypothetical protein
LNSEGVEYLLVGGYAVGYYGYPRATGDMDIWIGIGQENASALVRVLREFGFRSTPLSSDMFLAEKQVIRMGFPPVRIDLITTVSGVQFADCYVRRTVATIDGVPVNVVSVEDLKTNKKSAGRTKDLADLENLP